MKKRKRITKNSNVEATKINYELKDVKVFEQNCASPNAKFIYKYKDFEIEIWIDKHYEKRVLLGDENGKRIGIEEDIIKNLIIESVKYIFHFYIRHRISYINFFNKDKPTKNRIVLKDYRNVEEPLNVVIEIHFLDYSKYEITTITAMKCTDFHISDGQYNITISNDFINLNRLQNKILCNIDKISI